MNLQINLTKTCPELASEVEKTISHEAAQQSAKRNNQTISHEVAQQSAKRNNQITTDN